MSAFDQATLAALNQRIALFAGRPTGAPGRKVEPTGLHEVCACSVKASAGYEDDESEETQSHGYADADDGAGFQAFQEHEVLRAERMFGVTISVTRKTAASTHVDVEADYRCHRSIAAQIEVPRVRCRMPRIMSQGEEFGRLAGEAIEAIIEKANTRLELLRLIAAFQIFMEATIALKKQEEGKEAASAFDQAARAALGRRCALFTQ